MEIEFKNSKMKRICEDYKRLTLVYGNQQAEQIIRRISELDAAENLYDISKLPQARLHPLTGNYDGYLAVDLKQPYRLILSPANGDLADWKSITAIKIIEIKDYH